MLWMGDMMVADMMEWIGLDGIAVMAGWMDGWMDRWIEFDAME